MKLKGRGMGWRNWGKTLVGLFAPGLRRDQSAHHPMRGPVTHVLILDGTMSSLTPGCESNAGLTYRLLSEINGVGLNLFYEAGLQWQDWSATRDVITGRGINRQIRRAYGYLASHYHAGDRIYLFGYSRGAYAVRSLAGLIDQVGLLRAEHATERNVQLAYRHYQNEPGREAGRAFTRRYCHDAAVIEMLGVWDTVRALGLRLPILWRWSQPAHAFHSHRLGASVKYGCHALALDETRIAFAPVMWESTPESVSRIEQVWFRGAHGDVGGQLGGFDAARPLSNIPLIWMLSRAETCGMPLPDGWRLRFRTDIDAPSVGSWRRMGKLFWLRKRRRVGFDPSERLHESVRDRYEITRVEHVM